VAEDGQNGEILEHEHSPRNLGSSELIGARQPAFAECASGRTFSVTFACKEPHRIMNSCMKAHATQAEQDAAREEWFALRLQRQRERERIERKKAEQEDFIREWWGLPGRDEETRKKLAEKLAREEKVGGYARRPTTTDK